MAAPLVLNPQCLLSSKSRPLTFTGKGSCVLQTHMPYTFLNQSCIYSMEQAKLHRVASFRVIVGLSGKSRIFVGE